MENDPMAVAGATSDGGLLPFTEPIPEIQLIKGVAFPAWLKFRQLLVTGPPGSGKSTLICKIGGWSEEGYIDLSIPRWWTAQTLSIRPREIHLGIPCVGRREALAVYDPEWVAQSEEAPEMDLERIRIPPPKRSFFSVDWRRRYAFEFLLPPVETIYRWRVQRARRRTHHVDADVTPERVRRQLEVFFRVAHHLHTRGLQVYIREGTDGGLRRFVDRR